MDISNVKKNFHKKLLYIDRLDLIIKPKTLKVLYISNFDIIKHELWIKYITKAEPGANEIRIVRYLYMINSLFNLAPPVFPISGNKPKLDLNLSIVETRRSGSTEHTTTKRIDHPLYFKEFTNDMFQEDWDVNLAFRIYNSKGFKIMDCEFTSFDFSIYCQNAYKKAELRHLIKRNFLNHLLTILQNLGLKVEIQHNISTKKRRSLSNNVVSISSFKLVPDIFLTYKKKRTNEVFVAMTIYVCQPSTLKKYIQDFNDDRGKFSSKATNFRNVLRLNYCQALFASNNYGIITDYNTFLIYAYDKDVLKTQSSSETVPKFDASELHSEIIDIDKPHCAAKLASFIVTDCFENFE